MSNRKQRSSRGWIGSVTIIAVSLILAFGIALHSRTIVDQYNYHTYKPGTDIASFVSRAGFSKTGEFLFYASQPALKDSSDFNTKCGRSEAKTAILGCYSDQKIYIYDVHDSRLPGIRPTTAAHEMLHAAYDRLNDSKKKQVNRLLDKEYETLKDDQELVARMAFYDRTEPGERENELHSVIATEINTLSPELEEYYKQYFTNRAAVVTLHSQYESVFTGLQDRADALNRQITTINSSIKLNTATYNEEANTLTNDIRIFNQKAQQGEFGSQSDFNTQRARLVSSVARLEALRAQINDSVQEYNRLVAELNTIATQTEDLNHSIDSTLATPPSL